MTYKIGQRYRKDKAIWEIVRTEDIPTCGDNRCSSCTKKKYYYAVCVQKLELSHYSIGNTRTFDAESLQYYCEYLEGQDKPS